MMGIKTSDESITKGRQVNTKVDWNAIIKVFQNTSREKLADNITGLILQTRSNVSKGVLEKYVDKQSRETYIKTTIVELMSTPEYQLC
jgi:hypothetical protein